MLMKRSKEYLGEVIEKRLWQKTFDHASFTEPPVQGSVEFELTINFFDKRMAIIRQALGYSLANDVN